MMKLEQLPLIEVTYDGPKAVMTFLDKERGEIREVSFNKQTFDPAKSEFIDDAEKAAKVEEWCQDFFSLTFDELHQAVGTTHTVYAYDKFNSLFEVKQTAKFEKDMVGQIIQTEITKVEDNGRAIVIQFEYDGETYESKMNYSTYIENMKEWMVNPQLKRKKYEKFEEKFHVPVERCEEIVGEMAIIEIKLAFSKFVYCDIKPLMKKK